MNVVPMVSEPTRAVEGRKDKKETSISLLSSQSIDGFTKQVRLLRSSLRKQLQFDSELAILRDNLILIE